MARRIQVTIIGDSASLERSFARSAKAGKSFGLAMDSAGRSVAGMAKKFSEASVVIGAAVGYTIKKAVDFNQQMLLIQTQAGASASEVTVLSDAIMKMSKTSPQGPVKLAQGLYHLESLGLRGAKAIDTLKIASFAAGMGMASLEETATALGSVVVTGIKGAQNYSQAMAAIVATVGAGNVRMQDLAGALGNVTPAASSAGITLKEMGAALATLTDRGFSADEATTRFRFALTQMQRPTTASSKALADMGVNANNLGKVIREPNGLLKVLTILHDAIQKAGKVRGNRDLLAAFGGARSGLGIQTLVQSLDQGLSSYQAKLIQVGEGEKKYAENQAAYLLSPGYKLHSMWSQIQADIITVGNAFLPFGIKVVGGFSSAITGISNFIDKFSHAMNLHWKLNVIWTTAKDLKTKTENTLKSAIGKVDWNRVWSGAKGIDEGLKKRMDNVNWGSVGKKIGDGLTSAVFYALKGAKKIAGALSDIFEKINWSKLGEKIGPGLATAVIVAFATLLDPSFWIHHWQLALSIGSVAFGDGLGKLGYTMIGPFARLAERMGPGILRFGGDLAEKLLLAIAKVSPRLADALLEIGDQAGIWLGKGLSSLWKIADRQLANLLRPFVKFWRRLSPLFRFTLKVLGVDAAINAIKGWADSSWNTIKGLGDKFGGVFDDAFKAIKIKSLQAAIDFVDPWSSLPSKFGGWARDLKNQWNAEIEKMKVPPRPTLPEVPATGGAPAATKGNKANIADPIVAAVAATRKAIQSTITTAVGSNDRGGDRGSRYNTDGTIDPTQKAPPIPKVTTGDNPPPDPSLTTKKHPGPKLASIFPVSMQEALSKAVAANATASTSTDLTVQYAGMTRLVNAYKIALSYLKAEKETGAKRLLQVKEETTLTKAQAAIRKSMQAMMTQEIDTARGQIGGLFAGPVLQPTEAATGAMLGAPNADPKVLTADLVAQNAQFKTWVDDIDKLRKRGAPKELIKELQAGGVSNLEQVAALSGASKSVLDKYFSAFKSRESLAMKVAKVDMQAGIVNISGKVSQKTGNHPPPTYYGSPPKSGGGHPKPFAHGGVVPGRGSGDTVPAMLTPREMVLNRRHQRGLASVLGVSGDPHALFGTIQRFAKGGVVAPAGMTGPTALWGAGGQYPVLYSGGHWLFNAGPQKGNPVKQQDLAMKAWIVDHGFSHPGDGDIVNLADGYKKIVHKGFGGFMDKLGHGVGKMVKGMPHALKQQAEGLNQDLAAASYHIDRHLGTVMPFEKSSFKKDPHFFGNARTMAKGMYESMEMTAEHPLRDPASTLMNMFMVVPGVGLVAKAGTMGRLALAARTAGSAEEAASLVDISRLLEHGGDVRDARTLGGMARSLDGRLRRDVGPRINSMTHRYKQALANQSGHLNPGEWLPNKRMLKVYHGTTHEIRGKLEARDDGVSSLGKGVYVTPNEKIASHYTQFSARGGVGAAPHVSMHLIDESKLYKPKAGELPDWESGMPLATWRENLGKFQAKLKKQGYTGIDEDGHIVIFHEKDLHPLYPKSPGKSLFNKLKDESGHVSGEGWFHRWDKPVDPFGPEIPGFGHGQLGAFGERPLTEDNDSVSMYIHGVKKKTPHLKAPSSKAMGDAPWKQYFAMLLDKDKGRVFVGSPGALHQDLYDKIEDMFRRGGAVQHPDMWRKMQHQMLYFEQARGLFGETGRGIDQINVGGLVPYHSSTNNLLRNAAERAYRLGAGAMQLRHEEKLGRIPKLSRGGIATGPTLAMIGERGREAVLPLPPGGLMGGPREVVVQIDGREVGRALLPYQQRTAISTPVQRRGRHGGVGTGT